MTRDIEFHGGRLPNDPSKPRLKFRSFLEESFTFPDSVDYLSLVDSWPMYLNDRLGSCTCAGAGHLIQAESRYGQGATQTITDSDVLTAYSAVSGYDPATGANDNGAIMQEVLDYWRKVGIGGHNIVAFAEVDITNPGELMAAMNIFGALYIGFEFPRSAMDQFNNYEPWDYTGDSPIEGGHAVHGGAYKVGDNWKVTTWGEVQDMTQAFWDHYVFEAWVVITPEWLNAQGQSPTGLDLYGLGEQLQDLTGEPNPFLPAPTRGLLRFLNLLRNLLTQMKRWLSS